MYSRPSEYFSTIALSASGSPFAIASASFAGDSVPTLVPLAPGRTVESWPFEKIIRSSCDFMSSGDSISHREVFALAKHTDLSARQSQGGQAMWRKLATGEQRC